TAYGVMEDFVAGLIAERRAGQRLNAEEDLLDAFVAAIDAGELSEREVLDTLIFLFAAGYDTSKNVLTLLMHHLMGRPDICGRGMHLCLGQFIARAQLEEGLHLIAQRMTAPRPAGEIGWRPFPGVWGIKGLPIEFTPAPARAAQDA